MRSSFITTGPGRGDRRDGAKRKGSVKRNSARAARDVEYVSDVYAARARHSVSAVKRLCLNSWRPTR